MYTLGVLDKSTLGLLYSFDASPYLYQDLVFDYCNFSGVEYYISRAQFDINLELTDLERELSSFLVKPNENDSRYKYTTLVIAFERSTHQDAKNAILRGVDTILHHRLGLCCNIWVSEDDIGLAVQLENSNNTNERGVTLLERIKNAFYSSRK